ncbi:MAG TPA: hypothetical protein VFZ13_00060 [Gemmatimonadales bacterium]
MRLAWGIHGVGLVMAGALLTVAFSRVGRELAAGGFLVFTIGQGLILSTAAMEPSATSPAFGAGLALWAAGLVLVGVSRVFPIAVSALGFAAATLFGVTALRIFAGAAITPTSAALPFLAYPVFVATLAGWIVALWRRERSSGIDG